MVSGIERWCQLSSEKLTHEFSLICTSFQQNPPPPKVFRQIHPKACCTERAWNFEFHGRRRLCLICPSQGKERSMKIFGIKFFKFYIYVIPNRNMGNFVHPGKAFYPALALWKLSGLTFKSTHLWKPIRVHGLM